MTLTPADFAVLSPAGQEAVRKVGLAPERAVERAARERYPGNDSVAAAFFCKSFIAGADWQREQALSDEALKRAKEAFYDEGGGIEDALRATITAALGEG